jgi:hypothetical protein
VLRRSISQSWSFTGAASAPAPAPDVLCEVSSNPSEDMPAASSAINIRSFASIVLLPLPGNMDMSLVLPGQKSSYRSIRKREEIREANDTHVQAMHSPCTLRRFVKFAEQEFELHF